MSKGRGLARYIVRAFGLVVAGCGVVLIASFALMDPDGNTRPGIPDVVVAVPMGLACMLLAFGIFSLLNAVRMAYVLANHPWVPVEVTFSEVGAGITPNGQPVVSLRAGDREWDLTLAALRWRWGTFGGPTLLFAGKPAHGGVLATPDCRSIVWAGRSPLTRLLLGRRSRE